jgi:nuclear pore complex protein Nup107
MADRVGKEVEKFAERVDKWHAHGNDSEQAKYQSTLRMVGSFKSIADSTVQELRQQHEAENRGALQKSMRRRIRNMADEERPGQGGGNALLPQSIMPSIESSAPTSEEVHGLRQWEAEAATWDLLRVIIEHYHPEPGTDVAAEKEADLAAVGGVYRYSPNIDIWNRFLLEDDQAKEKELVLRWLERTAKNSESDIESITQQLETESGKDTNTWTSGWLDTRTKIKQLKRFLTNMDGPVRVGPNVADFKTRDQTQELVTQLDPDAPGRQKRALEKPDEYYERALWLACYEMLRRGVPWKEISDWCKDRSEGWRGISLGAAGESHPDGVPNIAGPTVGYLFRRTCYYAARGSRTQYESAVYGLLSGDVKTVESVCRSWDDHLYAHYNALLLSRFDDYLLRNYPTRLSQTVQKFSFRDAAGKLGNWESSSANVIDLLKQHKATAALAHLPIKLIQGCLISRTVDDLVQKVGEAVAVMLRKDDSNTTLILDPASEVASNSPTIYSQTGTAEKHYQLLATDPNGLRILVHMIIALRQGSGLLSINKAERTALDNVIVTYIEVLRTTRKIELIPLYAAQLDEDRRYHCLARILPDITNEEEQQTFIFLMEQYGIDPVRVVTENYLLVTNSIIKAKRTEPISRFDVLEPTGEQDYLWPGKRVKRKFSRAEITQNDEAVLESLRWHVHLEKDIEQSFSVLHTGLIYFLRKSSHNKHPLIH